MDILKDILIASGEIDRFFDGVSPTNLWRARNLSRPEKGLFEIDETESIRNGVVRPADIRIEDGIVRVRNRPRGVSTFDKPDVFKKGKWGDYKIPAGMKLPTGLVIVKDNFNQALGVTHYTIAPAHDMPIGQFRQLLNELAVIVHARAKVA